MILSLLLACASDAGLEKAPPDAGTSEGLPDPYDGGWLRDQDCPSRLAEADDFGNDAGDTPPDFALLDQFDEVLHLHDFCDHVVMLVWAGFG
jgi:hypothetical protein